MRESQDPKVTEALAVSRTALGVNADAHWRSYSEPRRVSFGLSRLICSCLAGA